MEGDWRVALAKIIFPTSIKNITTTDLFIYTTKTPYDNTPVPSSEGGAVIKQEDWSDNAKFEAGKYRTFSSILEQLDKATETKTPLNSADYVEDSIEISFESRYGINVRDRILFDVSGIQGVPDTNRGGYFIGTNYKVANPPDLTVFFVNTTIIEHQHVAGVKSPLLRIIENTKQVQDGKLLNTSTTAHKVFTELQFKKLITSTIEEIQIEGMSITGQKVPFVGTDLVALTLKFLKFQKMEQYYAQQTQLPHFSGPARQPGICFGSLAAGVGRVALPFAKKFLIPAVKSIGQEFSSQSIPELLDVASKKKTPKQAVRSAVRKTVKKQLGGSNRKRRSKRFIRRKKFTRGITLYQSYINVLPIETSHTSLNISKDLNC